jgi:hypothetical protein
LIDGRIESPYITYNSIPKPNDSSITLEELVESFRLEQLFRTNGDEVENAAMNELSSRCLYLRTNDMNVHEYKLTF